MAKREIINREYRCDKKAAGKLSFRNVKICFRNWLDFDEIIEASKGVALKYVMKEDG